MGKDFIDAGDYERACGQLSSCYKKCDGVSKPPDFVGGNTDTLNELSGMILDLMEELGCE